MARALVVITAVVLFSTAAYGGEATAPRAHGSAARLLRLERAEAGVGRCTSDRVCTFSPGEGRVVRAAGVVSRGNGARALKRVRPPAPIPSV